VTLDIAASSTLTWRIPRQIPSTGELGIELSQKLSAIALSDVRAKRIVVKAISDASSVSGNYHWYANETCLKTDLTPSALFHQTNLTLPSLDPQSRILLIPIVSRVSECSIIRKAFALSMRDDNGAATPTRVAKKRKSVLKAKPGYCSPVLLDNLMANGWKTKSLSAWSDTFPRQAVHGSRSNDSMFRSTG
jgi:hypothetical protein